LQTPTSKEEYYYRAIFHEHFPSDASFMRASRGKCSMQYKIALEWDEAFKNMNDPSGRAVANVHSDAYAK
jgi:asparagine synthase (glutamine-hydrolysing)